MSEFKPGDMVECVKADDFNPEIDTEFVPLVLGAHYTIEAVGMVDFIDGVFPAVWLREIKNAATGAYGASRVRLIKPRATDISIFREIVEREFDCVPTERV